jgi:hypothetical protein
MQTYLHELREAQRSGMKKLPIIGLVIGAVAVFFAKMRKKNEPAPATPPASEVPPATED